MPLDPAALARAVQDGPADDGGAAALDVVALADVMPERVSWLWPGWLARGKLHVFDGDPGQGKSTATVDVAARLSRGAPFPGETATRPPAPVVFVTFEDGLGDTVRPRLDAAGADLARVFAWRGRTTPDGATLPPVLPDDLGALRAVVDQCRPALIVIDPLMAALSGEVNSFRDQDVRRVLAHLSKVAESSGAAVLLVRHLRKGAAGNAIQAGGGSIGIIGAARIGWVLAPDPADPGVRILAQSKNNLARLAESRRVRLEDTPSGVARVLWDGTSPLTADALHAARGDDVQGDGGEDVAGWLRDVLANGPVASKEVRRLAGDQGFAWRTVHRHAKQLGVTMARTGFGPALASTWALPALVPPDPHSCHSRQLFTYGTSGTNGTNGAPDVPPCAACGRFPCAGIEPDRDLCGACAARAEEDRLTRGAAA